ncbi:MAG: KpsF/GutQ family sugar-phosphate isomerase [Bacteroidota bacterium]
MSTNSQDLIRRVGQRTIEIETETLVALKSSVDDTFVACVEALFQSSGRLVVSGIGKTAIVAQKIVATLNSTGTPALYLHAADAIHGDLGMVQPEDSVMLISKSGETDEIKLLSALVSKNGNRLIAMVGKADCSLSRQADFILRTPVDREADPNRLAPTASTTAQMALGDAIALSLMALRGFSPKDFAQYHPGGTLGKQLYLRVRELCALHEVPKVSPDTELQAVILEISSKRLGATAVIDPQTEELLGIITDGDLRRMLPGRSDISNITAADIMSKSPKSIHADALAVNALSLMRDNSISQLIVLDEKGKYHGFIHLHDLVREGLV